MTGTITDLAAQRGTGALLGEDGKTYWFQRRALKGCWFHELTKGAGVTFDAGPAFEAIAIRLIR